MARHITPAKARSPFSFALIVLCSFAISLTAASLTEIDRTPVLSIGGHQVSSYQVEKNYQRYLKSVSSSGARPPGGDEIQAWFTRFIDQQIIIGQALEEGYGERKEVKSGVLRMERHMLTQTEGPFYEMLLREEKRGLNLKEAYQKFKKRISVEVIRVPLSAPWADDLSIDRLSSLVMDNARQSGAAFYYKGDLAWPYVGFGDLAAVLENSTEPKSWSEFELAGLRVMVQITGVTTAPVPPFEQMEATLRRMNDAAQKQDLRVRREEAILVRDQFTFDWSGMQALLDALKVKTTEINEDAIASIKNQPLATIKQEGTTSAVTIGDYIAYHNALYVKGVLNTPLDVFSEVQDLIVAKQDYRDAVEAGVASQDKFSEDRTNFRNYLALELYEKEKLRPGLATTDEQVEAYYDLHREAYLEPVKIEGSLLSFGTPDAAVAYVQQIQSGNDVGRADASVPATKIGLTKDNIAQFLPVVPWVIVANPGARVIGPLTLPDGKEYRVWKRKAVVESSLKPLAMVAPQIRAALEQPLLEKREAALAHDLALKLAVNDHIDYKRYGIDSKVFKPWPN